MNMDRVLKGIFLKALAAEDRREKFPSLPEGEHTGVSGTLTLSAEKVAVKAPQQYTATVAVPFAGEVLPALTEEHAEALAILSQSMYDALVDAGTRCGRGEGWAADVLAAGFERAYGAGVRDAEAASLAALSRASKREASPTFAAKCREVWDTLFKPTVEKKSRAGGTTFPEGVRLTVSE